MWKGDDGSRKRLKTGSDTESEPVSGTKRGDPTSARVKQSLRVQSAICASHIISSSFDVTHAINIFLVGAWVGFQASVNTLKLTNRHFCLHHVERSTKHH